MNPGSDEAIKAGCICAVIDNNYGRRAPYPPDHWLLTVGCPVHLPDHPGASGDAPDTKGRR